MNFPELYSFLLQGKEIEIEFPSEKEYRNFRNSFATFKMRRDTTLVSIGVLEETQIKRITYRKVDADRESLLFHISFVTRAKVIPFTFRILTDSKEVS